LTIQRRTVLEGLLEGKDHPTADEVHQSIQSRLPGLSRATVYRVLDTLVELGVISKVYQPGAPALFDTGTHPHHHLACLSCNRIVDLDNHLPGASVLPDARNHGFEISESHVFFRGTCRECLRKRERPQASAARSVKNRCANAAPPKASVHSTKRNRGKKPG
jgi:Fur family peroxide stress response transcriptional regulator